MDEFDLMPASADLVEELLKRGIGCSEGMRAIFKWASNKPGKKWAELAAVQWDQDIASATGWLSDLAAKHRPPSSIRGLWFSAPEIEINDPDLYIGGCDSFEAGDDIEWAVNPVWPEGEHEPFPMQALAETRRVLGIGSEYSPEHTAEETLALYVLPLSYTALLVGEMCRACSPGAFELPPQGVGVVAGFASGDFVPVGRITAQGLQPPT